MAMASSAAGLAIPLTTSSFTPEMAEGRHIFDVYRYGLLKDFGVGKFVKSGTFDVGGYSWALLFFAAGSEPAPGGQHHASVYLQLLTPNVEVPAWFDLRLMDQSNGRWHSLFGDGGDTPRRHAVFKTFPTNPPLPPHHPPWCWGVPSWNGSNLEKPMYMRNGSLTIRCDMSVMMPPRVPEIEPGIRIKVPPPGLPMDLRAILGEKDGKDVTVRVRGEAFSAHRTVLAARSPVLKKKLLAAAADEAGPASPVEITMDDMDPEVFKSLLHFVYTDKLPPDAKVRDDGGDAAVGFVMRLLVAADGYGIERLKGICESLLCRHLSARTLMATMEIAGRHRCDKLREACVEFQAVCYPPGLVDRSSQRGLEEGEVDSEACKRIKKN